MPNHPRSGTPDGHEEKGFEPKRKKLSEEGIIPDDVAPYFDLWWRVACLGSHFQSRSSSIEWEQHLFMCQRASQPGMQGRGVAHLGRGQPGALQDPNHRERSTRRRGQRLTLKDRRYYGELPANGIVRRFGPGAGSV
jgi:hypothetical protein